MLGTKGQPSGKREEGRSPEKIFSLAERRGGGTQNRKKGGEKKKGKSELDHGRKMQNGGNMICFQKNVVSR